MAGPSPAGPPGTLGRVSWDELREVHRRFGVVRQRQRVVSGGALLVTFLIAATRLVRTTEDFGTLGLLLGVGVTVLIASAIAFSLWNWRCPRCRRFLGLSTDIASCPKCGIPLV